jgi:hypothetical protein
MDFLSSLHEEMQKADEEAKRLHAATSEMQEYIRQ